MDLKNTIRISRNFYLFFLLSVVITICNANLDIYVPGQDYPDFLEMPSGLSFTCRDKIPGFYADPQTRCQAWHWCVPGGVRYSFLCTPGTVFNQATRVCDWFFNVNCPGSEGLYGINDDLYKDNFGNYILG